MMGRCCTRRIRDSLGFVYLKPMILYVKHAWLAEPSMLWRPTYCDLGLSVVTSPVSLFIL
jgi:hypothetical protein